MNTLNLIKKTGYGKTLVVTLLLLYSLAASLVSVHRHWQFTSFWYDFGIFDQTAWQVSRFHIPYIPTLKPPIGKINWGDHLNISIISLAPFYWISDNQAVIYIAQVIFATFGAWFIYLISLKELKSPLPRIAILVSYLGFIGLQNALYTDVHNIVYALLPMSLVFYSIYFDKPKLYWTSLFWMIGWQENLASVGIGIGFFIIIKDRSKLKQGILTIFLSAIYALLATKFIIPFLNNGAYTYRPSIPPDVQTGIQELFFPINPKIQTILVSFATFGGLPIFSVTTWPLLVDHFVQRFVLNDAQTRWTLSFHYNVPLCIILSIACIEVLKKLQNFHWTKFFISAWSLITIAIVIFIHRFYLHGPLMMSVNPAFYSNTTRNQTAHEFLAKIPRSGYIMAANNFAAHLTHSKVMLLHQDFESIKPDWIVFSQDFNQNPNNYFILGSDSFKRFFYDLHWSPNYTLYLETQQSWQIYQRKHHPVIFCTPLNKE